MRHQLLGPVIEALLVSCVLVSGCALFEANPLGPPVKVPEQPAADEKLTRLVKDDVSNWADAPWTLGRVFQVEASWRQLRHETTGVPIGKAIGVDATGKNGKGECYLVHLDVIEDNGTYRIEAAEREIPKERGLTRRIHPIACSDL